MHHSHSHSTIERAKSPGTMRKPRPNDEMKDPGPGPRPGPGPGKDILEQPLTTQSLITLLTHNITTAHHYIPSLIPSHHHIFSLILSYPTDLSPSTLSPPSTPITLP